MNTFKNRDSGSAEGTFVMSIVGIVLVLGIIVGSIWLIGGTWSETNASNMTCVYNGGPIDDNNYVTYAEPGSGRDYQGFMSEATNVPVGIRQYRVALDETQGDVVGGDSVDVRVKGYDMQFEPTVIFTFSTVMDADGKPTSCTFIEKQLRQFGATDFDTVGGKYNGYLNERFRPILNNVSSRVLQKGDPGDLKFNIGGARDAAAVAIGVDLKQALKSLGGDFFCDDTYSFGQGEEECGDSLTVILPEPKLKDPADEAQLSKPQRAKIDADNEIAAANEAARKAQQVADARATEAEAAKTLADANEIIANENARVLQAQAANDYAWCTFLTSLGQDCALVKAAQNNDYPDVVVGSETSVAVPVQQ